MSLSNLDGPILMIVRGIPGSGKSFLAKELTRLMPPDTFEVLDPDTVDQNSQSFQDLSQKLLSDGVDARFHLYRYVRMKAFAAVDAKKLLIWNQPFIDFDGLHKTIEKLQTYANERGLDLPVIVVEVELDGETAKERVTIRKSRNGHGPDEQGLDRFINDYKTFAGEGFKTVSIPGFGDVQSRIAVIESALDEIA